MIGIPHGEDLLLPRSRVTLAMLFSAILVSFNTFHLPTGMAWNLEHLPTDVLIASDRALSIIHMERLYASCIFPFSPGWLQFSMLVLPQLKVDPFPLPFKLLRLQFVSFLPLQVLYANTSTVLFHLIIVGIAIIRPLGESDLLMVHCS